MTQFSDVDPEKKEDAYSKFMLHEFNAHSLPMFYKEHAEAARKYHRSFSLLALIKNLKSVDDNVAKDIKKFWSYPANVPHQHSADESLQTAVARMLTHDGSNLNGAFAKWFLEISTDLVHGRTVGSPCFDDAWKLFVLLMTTVKVTLKQRERIVGLGKVQRKLERLFSPCSGIHAANEMEEAMDEKRALLLAFLMELDPLPFSQTQAPPCAPVASTSLDD